MEHLLSAWPGIAQRLRDTNILLLLDYDGTLTPIVDRPEMAELAEEVRGLLKALARQRRLTVGVISGRALVDLKNKVKTNGIIYAGNHGLEIEGPGINFINPIAEEMKPIVRIMSQVLARALATIRGVLVENKELSLSVHYRMVAEDKTDEVKTRFERVVSGVRHIGKIKVTFGKKVFEVRPAVDWDKGKAIKLLMKRYGKGGRNSKLFPIFLGDDVTDEDGFRVIEKYGNGLSVLVGEAKPDTEAHYYLKSPAEVAVFLGVLLKYAQRGLKWT